MACIKKKRNWMEIDDEIRRQEAKRVLEHTRAVAYSCLAKLQPYPDQNGRNHSSDVDQALYLRLRAHLLQIVDDPKVGITDSAVYAEILKYEAHENQ